MRSSLRLQIINKTLMRKIHGLFPERATFQVHDIKRLLRARYARSLESGRAAFERTLINDDSKFDNFRFVDKGVLSDEEWQGFFTFRQTGCVQCHRGPDFAGPPPLARGAGFYQKFPRFTDNTYVTQYKLLENKGRFNATGLESDRHVYRVQSLRNVAVTAPYFHNGSVTSLEEAVRVCAKAANGKDLNPTKVKSISTFLNTPMGEFRPIPAPELP